MISTCHLRSKDSDTYVVEDLRTAPHPPRVVVVKGHGKDIVLPQERDLQKVIDLGFLVVGHIRRQRELDVTLCGVISQEGGAFAVKTRH